MANQFIARKGLIALADSQITGSLNISQNIVAGGTVQATFDTSTATAISGAFDSVSSSLATRVASQEAFSSSLDATFATDSQVATAVSSLNAATSSYLLNTTDTLTGDLTVTDIIKADSSSTGDYVRLYGASGTGQWDIYGNGENLRFSENSGGGGRVVIDSSMTTGGDILMQNANPILNLQRSNNAGSPAARINFLTSDNTVRWQVATNQSIGLGFEINQGDGSNPRLYIDTNGNVGIGTTGPSYKTVISGNNSAYWGGSSFTGGTPLALSINNTQNGGYDSVLLFQQADSGGTVKNAGGIGMVGRSSWTAGNNATQISDMYFLVRNDSGGISERMRIGTDGALGLNTTFSGINTRSRLNIKASGSDGNQIYLIQQNDDRGWRLKAKNDGHFYLDSAYTSTDSNVLVARFDTGRVGIGITSPETRLGVNAGGSNGFSSGTLPPGVTIYGSSTDGYGTMLSFKPASGDQGVAGIGSFRVSNYTTDLRFYTNSTAASNSFTERMRIDSSGNVGIGVTPADTFNFGKALDVGSTTGAFLYLRDTDYANGVGGIGMSSGNLYISNKAAGDIRFFTNNDADERMRITSGGYLKASNYGTYFNSSDSYHEFISNDNNWTILTGNTNASPFGMLVEYTTNANGSSNFPFYFNVVGVGKRIAFRSDGGLENIQANDVNLSDERVKKDIAPLTSYWDKFKALEVVTFKYKDQTHDNDNIGFIAQQVEQVAPEFISNEGWQQDAFDNEEEPLKAIYTADMYNASIKVLQEAMLKIEALEAEIQALKNS